MGQEFRWTKKAERAARLVADDTLSDEQIAAKLRIARSTLSRWKAHPEFQARVRAIVSEYREAILAEGIADKQNRILALNERWRRLQQVIEERARDPDMAKVPGGKTGLLVRQLKSIGVGENNTVVEEYVVDVGLLRELRAHEQQAAQELGQWVEKTDQKLDVSEAFVAALREFGRGSDA